LNNNNSYQLYIGNNCCSCEKIIDYMKEKNISTSVTNIDTDDYDLPFSLMIIPALVKDEKLIAYGPDIKKHVDTIS
jgi:predicted thioredoxin/glutaredoxin